MPGANVALTRVRGTLVVTFQGAADSGTLAAASEVLMEELERRRADDVVFDVSGCDVIDLEEFEGLRKLVQRAEWLGVRGIIAGLRPGIVTYLVSAGVPTDTLHVALDLEQALLEIDPDRNLRSR
jgi:hypothetical protein